MTPDTSFDSRIPPRPTWFHKDPEIALSELVMAVTAASRSGALRR